MKLFIHIGTEKTGSSHIQTLCVNARAHLQSSGIWFPKGIARHEKRMRAGLVSAGNAFLLAQQGRKRDRAGVEKILESYREEARSNACQSVFLTSELMLPYIADGDSWSLLFGEAKRIGYRSISVLILLRDPMDQLISLYKHRAKNGTAGRIDEWVERDYRLPEDLELLRKNAGGKDIELVARRYTRKAGVLEQIFFYDWLSIEAPKVAMGGEVNPSLSLSELELIRCLNERRPSVVPFLRERLQALSRVNMLQHGALEVYARAVAERVVSENREEWARWNRILPAGEKLCVPHGATNIPAWSGDVVFSASQTATIASFMATTARLRFILVLFWQSRLRPFLGRIRRWLKIEKAHLD